MADNMNAHTEELDEAGLEEIPQAKYPRFVSHSVQQGFLRIYSKGEDHEVEITPQRAAILLADISRWLCRIIQAG